MPSDSEVLSLLHLSTTRKPEPTEAQQQELRKVFETFHADGQPRLDYHGLKCCLRAHGLDVRKHEVLQLMEKHDPAGSGYIGYAEYLSIAAERLCARDPEEELLRAFELIDSDASGRISLRNLRQASREVGAPFAEHVLQDMIAQFDEDEDGEISLQEFAAIMGVELSRKYAGASELPSPPEVVAPTTKRMQVIAKNRLRGFEDEAYNRTRRWSGSTKSELGLEKISFSHSH